MNPEPMMDDLASPPPPSAHTRAYLYEAVEAVLLLGDYQKRSAQPYAVQDFCKMALGGIDKIAAFEISAIFTIDADSSDLKLAAVTPADRPDEIETQLEHLIDQGTVAWAIRERRGITVVSQKGDTRVFLHVITTYARIRGLFIGVLPKREDVPASESAPVEGRGAQEAPSPTRRVHFPDGALELLSLFMRSVATSLESIEYIDLLAYQNQQLQQQVEEKMRLLLRHERELANTRKLNAVASLAGGIAHEYNNALMSLMGYGELAKMASRDNPKVFSYLEKITPVVERMSQLTNQLLAYSQGGKYHKESVDLPELVRRVLATNKGNLDPDVMLETAFEGQGLCIEGDRNQLQRALTALLANASEALQDGGEIAIGVHRVAFDQIPADCAARLAPGDFLQLEIRDTGCGMDRETRERMFEPFFSTKFAGRGLSLAAVYGIVENHKGAIAVESRRGHGTRLALYLPLFRDTTTESP
ncbi:MAG: ATP-binding protein [Desulfosarcinaceae bacterium]|nr:ATP-binding protein [Desulfosarcinaceae bacterium]